MPPICVQDFMHTTLQGPAPLEAGLQQFVFIKVRGYYSRAELNAAKRARPVPPGVRALIC